VADAGRSAHSKQYDFGRLALSGVYLILVSFTVHSGEEYSFFSANTIQ
jgi:hypothetical protein